MTTRASRLAWRETIVCVAGLWTLALAAMLWLDAFWVSVVITTMMWIHLCAAWNIVGGFAGQVSFGNAAFFGVGAYTSTVLAARYGVSPWLGMLAGAVLAAALAWVTGFFPFRRGLSHLVFALMTLALGYAMQFGVSGMAALGGSNGLFIPVRGLSFWDLRFENPFAFLAVICTMASLVLLGSCWLYSGRIGFRWRALRDSEPAAASIGARAFQLKQMAFMLSAALTAAAGTFYAQFVGFIDPESVFGVGVTIQILLLAVVGGSGTLAGPVLGPLLLVPGGEALRVMLSGIGGDGINNLLFGAMLMVVIGLWPGGIASLFRGWSGARTVNPALIAVTERLPERESSGQGGVLLDSKGISKSFGGLRVLKGVTFQLRRGEITGVIGPNGAGKTTLFSILAGFQPPSGGAIWFAGREIQGRPPDEICVLGIARTFQIPHLFESFSVYETVLTGAMLRCSDAAAHDLASRIIARAGLDPEKPSAVLTLAERRRLEIARALATEPTLLLLDEVLAGLTPPEVEAALDLLREIRASGVTVCLIEHNMKAVMGVCDTIVVLDAGDVIKIGTPSEVASDPAVIAAYLGAPQVAGARAASTAGASA